MLILTYLQILGLREEVTRAISEGTVSSRVNAQYILSILLPCNNTEKI